jgi:hypothetical protein
MSALQRTAEAFLAAFNNLSASEHVALRAENCTHMFAPASLNPPAPKSNSDFAAHITNLRSILAHFPVTAKEINLNEAGKQITIWATGVPEFKSEVKGSSEDGDWEYMGEYIFILDLDEKGKIKRIVEFLDSKNTMVLLEMVEKAKANLAAQDKSEGREGEEGGNLGFR